MANNVAVKTYLLNKGIAPNSIGWDNNSKMVQVNGQNFLKPASILSGASYDSQQNLDNTFKTYQQGQAQQAQMAQQQQMLGVQQDQKAKGDAIFNASLGIKPTTTVPTATPGQLTGVSPQSTGYAGTPMGNQQGYSPISPTGTTTTVNTNPTAQITPQWKTDLELFKTNPQAASIARAEAQADADRYLKAGDMKAYGEALRWIGQIDQASPPVQMQTPETVDPQVSADDKQLRDLISQIYNKMNNPTQTDPYSTPEFKAAQAQQQLAAQRGIRANQEATGAAGFGRSTRNTEGAQRIQNEADTQLYTQIVPQIMQALANKDHQQLSDLVSLLNPLQQMAETSYNRNRDTKGDLERAANTKYNQEQDKIANDRNAASDKLINEGRALTNKISQKEYDALDAEIKGKADKLEQELAKGEKDLATADYEYEQLTNPDSMTNKINALDLKIKEAEAKNVDEMADIALKTAKKQLAEIGKHYVTPKEPPTADQIKEDGLRMRLLEAQVATAEGKQVKDPVTAEEYDKYITPRYDGTTYKLLNGAEIENQILTSGLSDYQMYKLYKKHGLPFDGPPPSPDPY